MRGFCFEVYGSESARIFCVCFTRRSSQKWRGNQILWGSLQRRVSGRKKWNLELSISASERMTHIESFLTRPVLLSDNGWPFASKRHSHRTIYPFLLWFTLIMYLSIMLNNDLRLTSHTSTINIYCSAVTVINLWLSDLIQVHVCFVTELF